MRSGCVAEFATHDGKTNKILNYRKIEHSLLKNVQVELAAGIVATSAIVTLASVSSATDMHTSLVPPHLLINSDALVLLSMAAATVDTSTGRLISSVDDTKFCTMLNVFGIFLTVSQSIDDSDLLSIRLASCNKFVLSKALFSWALKSMLQSVSLLSVLTRDKYNLFTLPYASCFGVTMVTTVPIDADTIATGLFWPSLSKSTSLESRSLFTSEPPQFDWAMTLAQIFGIMSIGDSMPDELGDGAADSDDDWLDDELVLAVHNLDT